MPVTAPSSITMILSASMTLEMRWAMMILVESFNSLRKDWRMEASVAVSTAEVESSSINIFGCFNSVFVGGFYKTAFYFGKPFVIHIIVTFVIVFIAEALHHVPGMEAVNAFGFEHIGLQLALLLAGAAAFIVLTALSLKRSEKNFEKIDL